MQRGHHGRSSWSGVRFLFHQWLTQDLAFSSFPRMKCVAVGVGDCHPPQRSLGRCPKPHAWSHG